MPHDDIYDVTYAIFSEIGWYLGGVFIGFLDTDPILPLWFRFSVAVT